MFRNVEKSIVNKAKTICELCRFKRGSLVSLWELNWEMLKNLYQVNT